MASPFTAGAFSQGLRQAIDDIIAGEQYKMSRKDMMEEIARREAGLAHQRQMQQSGLAMDMAKLAEMVRSNRVSEQAEAAEVQRQEEARRRQEAALSSMMPWGKPVLTPEQTGAVGRGVGMVMPGGAQMGERIAEQFTYQPNIGEVMATLGRAGITPGAGMQEAAAGVTPKGVQSIEARNRSPYTLAKIADMEADNERADRALLSGSAEFMRTEGMRFLQLARLYGAQGDGPSADFYARRGKELMNSVAVATGIAGTGVKEPWLPEGEPPMWGGGSPPSPIPVMDTPPPVTPKPNKKDSDSKKYPGGTSAMNRDLKTVADYWAETKWRGKSKKDKPKRTQAALVARAAWDRLKAHGIDPGLSRPTGSTGMVAAPKEAPRRSIGEWWSDFRNRGRGQPAQSSGKTSLEEIMG